MEPNEAALFIGWEVYAVAAIFTAQKTEKSAQSKVIKEVRDGLAIFDKGDQTNGAFTSYPTQNFVSEDSKIYISTTIPEEIKANFAPDCFVFSAISNGIDVYWDGLSTTIEPQFDPKWLSRRVSDDVGNDEGLTTVYRLNQSKFKDTFGRDLEPQFVLFVENHNEPENEVQK